MNNSIKRKITLIITCVLILLIVFTKNIIEINKTPNNIEKTPEKVITNTEFVKRAHAAKMISLLMYSEKDLAGLERNIVYEDTSAKYWFDKYINGIYTMGIIEEGTQILENSYRPMEDMTYGECKSFIERLLLTTQKSKPMDSYNKIIRSANVNLDAMDSKAPISMEEWLKLYNVLVEEFPEGNVVIKNLYILGSSSDYIELGAFDMNTDSGVFSYQGVDVSEYKDQIVEAYVKDSEILYLKPTDQPMTIRNVWIIDGKEKEVNTYICGVKKTFETKNTLAKEIKECVGDLEIANNKITKVSIKPDIINGRVLVANDKYIEIEDYGKLYLEDGYRIYKIYGELMMEVSNGILVGYNTTDFVVSNGKICAALIKSSIKAKDIRVLLKTTDFSSAYHDEVILSSDSPFTYTCGKKVKEFDAGSKVTIKPDNSLFKNGRIKFKSKSENGKFKIESITRNGGTPEYRGNIEVQKNEQGLILINELPIEEYLYGVVPSEMPPSYGLESLKVQAICARSYAYNQLLENKYAEFGAHVDDSVSCQVYNNAKEDSTATLAVKDTYGKVIEYNHEIITAYYFSTSCGHTASADEVWPGSNKIPYATGQLQETKIDKKGNVGFSDKKADYAKEKAFREFIVNNELSTYDSDFPWYRWQVTIELADLKTSIDRNLQKRYEANPSLIQTLVNGEYKSIPISTVGEVKEIKVNNRGTGGLVTEIIISGSKNTIKVTSEYNVRLLLAPINDTIVRKDDSKVDSLSMLPSGFFVMDEIKDGGKVKGIKFSGGGYGHGVGMSQNGVKGMSDLGAKYEDIIKHYYQDTEIGFIY